MSIQSEINRINNNVQSTLQTIADTGIEVGTNSDALPAAAAALANEKADVDHTHSEYAAASHTHSEYAASNHTHSGYAASSHNQAASTITGGTFAGQVVAHSSYESYSTYLLRNCRLSSSDSTPGNNGEICWTYK